MQTVPIFVADFTVEGNGYSAFGGCPVDFPGAAQYTVEEMGYKKVAVIYANTPPGLECYADTEERFWKFLQTEYDFEFMGFPDNSGDPTDNDTTVQAMADFYGDTPAEDRVVYFGVAAADCNEIMNAISANGVETNVFASGACIDDSVLANPASHGAAFNSQSYIADRPELYDDYLAWAITAREERLDNSSLREAPVSAFMRNTYEAGIMVYQVMSDLAASGGDLDDRAQILAAFANMENQHVLGRPAVSCNDNSAEFASVCANKMTVIEWTGEMWDEGPLGGKFLDVSGLHARVAAGSPRPAPEG